ncbi:hypothetical protein WKK05_03530 [Nostoc sp. UHCC 0302]|uniref:hypothetical protein n=1 Tax=Nostoc sp. UHCC 0302 TaxID=3134896 RepID=UPI00311CA829
MLSSQARGIKATRFCAKKLHELLPRENQVYGIEVKGSCQGSYDAAPVNDADK